MPAHAIRRTFEEPARPLLVLTGLRRRLLMAAYVAILLVTFGGMAYTAAVSPLLLFGMLLLCYVLENLQFVLGHIALHAAFIEVPESRMATLTHHGFVHHYRDIRAFHKSWLETRMSYFFCTQNGLRSTTTLGFGMAYLLTVAAIAAVAGWAPALSALSCMWAARLLQSVGHEWYHHNDRAGFYWRPTFLLLSALEWVGIMSTRRHLAHHRHHLKDLGDVVHWLDLYVPGGERLGDAIWARLVQLHVPGQRRMLSALLRLLFAYSLFHYGTIVIASVLAAGL